MSRHYGKYHPTLFKAEPPPATNLISVKNGLIMYAIACEHFDANERLTSAEIIYVHATDAGHARQQFIKIHSNQRKHRMVAVAPVIGYFVDDNHGEKLSVN